MKTKEELNAIKKDIETLNEGVRELTDEEMEHVTGGVATSFCGTCIHFTPINPNFGQVHTNCQEWSTAANMCRYIL